jgi:hypothetical protein
MDISQKRNFLFQNISVIFYWSFNGSVETAAPAQMLPLLVTAVYCGELQ